MFREFGHVAILGVITKWARADGDNEALWHVRHEDGDEEDLSEKETEDAIEAYKSFFKHDPDPNPSARTRFVHMRRATPRVGSEQPLWHVTLNHNSDDLDDDDDDKNDDYSGVVDRDERKKRRLRTSKSCETVVKRIKRAK